MILASFHPIELVDIQNRIFRIGPATATENVADMDDFAEKYYCVADRCVVIGHYSYENGPTVKRAYVAPASLLGNLGCIGWVADDEGDPVIGGYFDVDRDFARCFGG